MKYLASFKKVVLRCVKNRWLPADPFPDFELTRKEVIRHPLTQWELDKIAGKNFSNERLRNVRDIFVFSCYTGLAYADVAKLTGGELIKGVDGDNGSSLHGRKLKPVAPYHFYRLYIKYWKDMRTIQNV